LKQITNVLFPVSIQKALLMTKSADVLESLLESLQICQIRVGQPVVRAAEELARELVEGEGTEKSATEAADQATRIVSLAKELSD
jgi:hypothetical protein